MTIEITRIRILALVASSIVSGGTLLYAVDPPPPDGGPAPRQASDPQVDRALIDKMLGYQPKQKDVVYDLPDKAGIAKCTIERGNGSFVIRDVNGTVLRKFIDTDGNNMVDQFSYFKDGVEVYRENDLDKNQIFDQFRWLNTAGSRIGVNKDQDDKNTIDYWQTISAEEVTAEVVAALRDRDQARFKRLLLTKPELQSLGLGKAKTEQIGKMLDAAVANFTALANKKGLISPDTRWVSFGGTQPATVPAGTEDSTSDVVVYENVAAMIETAGKADALTVGALVRVRDTWRLIDAPLEPGNNVAGEVAPIFVVAERGRSVGIDGGGAPNTAEMDILAEIQKLDPNDHARRATKLLEAAKVGSTERRPQWIRQSADSFAAAVQTQNHAKSIDGLKALVDTLKNGGGDEETTLYVELRYLMASHGQKLTRTDVDYPKLMAEWITELEDYLAVARKYPDSADAMAELAISYEMTGDDTNAMKWYRSVSREFPKSIAATKATGAVARLDSVGRPLQLTGKPINSSTAVDAKSLKGKVVLVQYWASWCDPCRADLPMLRELRGKYKGSFEVVGVCLDNSKSDMQAYLKENTTPWPVLFEDGGLESRYANEMGVHTLPLMILVDQSGKVVNRNIRSVELDAELKKLIK